MKYVFLYELDSVRKTDKEILIGQQALYREIVLNGNVVVLTLNQLVDSRAFFSLLDDQENDENERKGIRGYIDRLRGGSREKRWAHHYYDSILSLFEQGAICVSQFGEIGQSIAGYLINSLSPERTFVYSGWPLKSTQKNLIALIRNSLICSDLSEINRYKNGQRTDEELCRLFDEYVYVTDESDSKDKKKYPKCIPTNRKPAQLRSEIVNIYWFLKLVLRLSVMHDIYISPKDKDEFKLCHMEHILEIVGSMDLTGGGYDRWSESLGILNRISEELRKDNNNKSRSAYTVKLKEMEQQGYSDPDYNVDDLRFAEAIVNLCYNYAIEISIRNISKTYNFCELKDKNLLAEGTFRKDFLRKLRNDWNVDPRTRDQRYLQGETDQFDEYIPEKSFPDFERAARVVGYRKTRIRKNSIEKKEDQNSDTRIERYESGLEEQRRKARLRLNFGLINGFLIANVCIVIVCLLEFAMQIVQEMMEDHLGFSPVVTEIIATISVLVITEMITAMLAKLIPGFLSLSEAIAKLFRFFSDGFLVGVHRHNWDIPYDHSKEAETYEKEDFSVEIKVEADKQSRYTETNEWKRYEKLREKQEADFPKEKYRFVFEPEIVNEFYRLTGKRMGVVYEGDSKYMVVDLVFDGDGEVKPDDPRLHTLERTIEKEEG